MRNYVFNELGYANTHELMPILSWSQYIYSVTPRNNCWLSEEDLNVKM